MLLNLLLPNSVHLIVLKHAQMVWFERTRFMRPLVISLDIASLGAGSL